MAYEPFAMETLDTAIENVRKSVREFDDYLARPVLDIFPTLSPPLREIRGLAGTIDLNHLSSVPVRSLTSLHNLIFEVTECIRNFMVPSFPVEDKVQHGVERPRVHTQSQVNINSWRGKLEHDHDQLFQLIGPIVAQQQARLGHAAGASPFSINSDRSISKERLSEKVVWRYMPLRNLIRCEEACGIWMPSLNVLRAWSKRGIVDTHEGEIPPVVERLKQEYEHSIAAGGAAIQEFRQKYGLDEHEFERLAKNISHLSLEMDNTFVSSWSQKRNETANMWHQYGDLGRGVAIKVNLGKLLEHSWRVFSDLSGLVGPNRLSGLILREVKYLSFDATDQAPAVDDLHLPFLKRDLFEEEHEIRLVAFTSRSLPSQGFSLICNLADLIDEIVVGPHGDLDTTISEIKKRAFDLSEVPVRPSLITPN